MKEPFSNFIQRLQREIGQAASRSARRKFISNFRPRHRHREDRGQTSDPPAQPAEPDYSQWIEQNEPDPDELLQQERNAALLGYTPLISIIVPVFHPPLADLEQTILSVMGQSYPFWELCLTAIDPGFPGLSDLLFRFANLDKRVRLEFMDDGRDLSASYNLSLQIAQGEYSVFLAQQDLLAPFALFEIAWALNRDRGLDLIYSDHDLIEFDTNRRKMPLFKPDWSPDLMLSSNYIGPTVVLRTSLAQTAGGFIPDYGNTQDWDLFLKVSERTANIAHIPKILYHSRSSNHDTTSGNKPEKKLPSNPISPIQAHLSRLGLPGAQAYRDRFGVIRVRWKFDRNQTVSIIIPSANADPALEACVDLILKVTDYPNFEIIIVNHGRKRPEEFAYFRKISQNEQIRVIHADRPLNYSAANNLGARQANGNIFLFLNSQTIIIAQDWLDELVMWIGREQVGLVGAKLLSPDGAIQHAGIIIGMTGFAGHLFADQPEHQWTRFGPAEWYRDFKAISGACMMISRQLFEQIGGFDETLIQFGNDVEICLRAARAGQRIVYNPFARLSIQQTPGWTADIPVQDFRVAYTHYLPTLRNGDPYFNPNLSYWHSTPTLAAPGEQQPIDFVMGFLKQLRVSGSQKQNS